MLQTQELQKTHVRKPNMRNKRSKHLVRMVHRNRSDQLPSLWHFLLVAESAAASEVLSELHLHHSLTVASIQIEMWWSIWVTRKQVALALTYFLPSQEHESTHQQSKWLQPYKITSLNQRYQFFFPSFI